MIPSFRATKDTNQLFKLFVKTFIRIIYQEKPKRIASLVLNANFLITPINQQSPVTANFSLETLGNS